MVKIVLSRKTFYILLGVFVFVLLGIGVYAYGTNDPSTFGHTISEFAPPSDCSTGSYFIKWIGSWTCANP